MKWIRPLACAVALSTFPAVVACGDPPAPGAVSAVNASDLDSGTVDSSPSAGDDATRTSPNDSGAADVSHEQQHVDATPTAFVAAAHPPWPQVPLMSPGLYLAPMKLVSIVAQGDPLEKNLFAFGDALVASAWFAQSGHDYSLGTPALATVHVTGPASITVPNPPNAHVDPQNPSRDEMSAYIKALINSGKAPQPDSHTLYMLYLPPNVVAFDDASGSSNKDCQFYAGYHTAFDTFALADGGGLSGTAFGFAQLCGNAQALGNLDTLTVAASHEIIEAATNPLPGYGWGLTSPTPSTTPWTDSPYSTLGGEVGDLCADTAWTEGTYWYQRTWSNTAARGVGDPCVPPHPNAPYVNASTPKPWYTVSPGGSVDIPVTGFSDRAAPDWLLTPNVGASNDTGNKLSSKITSSTTAQTVIGPVATTNNGRTATLKVSAAAGAPAGTWTMIEITSQPLVRGTGDPQEYWPVGVYVQ